MGIHTLPNLSAAVEDFRRARRRAALERILARLSGRSADLLSYEDVRQKLRAREGSTQELKDIPLDAIVGSVGRYTDFTRSFLPTRDSDEGRWARVKTAVTGLKGVPPIDVYQIGAAYFVKDGNHRVSIARELNATHIQAYVTEVHTKVPLTPDDEPEDVILKAEYARFLEHTQLDQTRPQADLAVTVPGQYQHLEEHIKVHRHFMGIEKQREIPYPEAAAHWYDTVYQPVVRLIWEQGILQDFPDRTETDLYLWLAEHRAALEQAFGWDIAPATAAADLAARFSTRPQRVAARVGERILDALTPDELESGPPAGQWRRERVEARRSDRLFTNILVGIDGQEPGWHAVEQALLVARREGGRLRAVHVTTADPPEDIEDPDALRSAFEQHCQDAGIPGQMVISAGSVSRRVCDNARWADLVVLSLSHPPTPSPLSKLSSGMSTLIRRCPRPILSVPGAPSPLDRLLLAYDGSAKAEEALFVATYLSAGWNAPLVVVTVSENGLDTGSLCEHAQAYLEAHGVQAPCVEKEGPAAEAILETAAEHGSELLIAGGYGASPVLEIVLGSTLDRILRTVRKPVLICR
ncbi:MAG: universal stress protein [Anaerolineae bacterium]|nr:universal stress protein [Anaerolineae bacterium]